MTLTTISNVDSGKRLGSYFGKMSYVPNLPYFTRRDRRIIERTGAKRKEAIKTLESFRSQTLDFLGTSERMLEIVDSIPFPDLEGIEQLSHEIVSVTEFRKKNLLKIEALFPVQIIDELKSILTNLEIINLGILRRSKEILSAHNLKGALERGYLIISDINNAQYSLDLNFRIEISKEDDEFRGEIGRLDIVEYGESVDEIVAGIKEYVTELYDELSVSLDSTLSPSLLHNKNILIHSITKEEVE
jgi:DNA-directed RNA polymerase subunit F